jgi:hypothetical protein
MFVEAKLGALLQANQRLEKTLYLSFPRQRKTRATTNIANTFVNSIIYENIFFYIVSEIATTDIMS